MAGFVQVPEYLKSFIGQRRNKRHQIQRSDTTELSDLIARDTDEESPEVLNNSSSAPSRHNISSRVQHLRKRFTGWRFGVLHFATWASIVCVINLAFTVWGLVKFKRTGDTLSYGDCGRIKNLNRTLHILVNVLSTILLSGSNYCMQCLSAPTRAEIDRAHAENRWLDIGVPSFRNLRHIQARRLCVWLLLGLSSVPLHLLYNSMIYGSISTNSYIAFVVSEAFLHSEECLNCTDSVNREAPIVLPMLWEKSRQGLLDHLNPTECLNAYATSIQSSRRNVLVVIDNKVIDKSLLKSQLNNSNVYEENFFSAYIGTDPVSASNSYSWICGRYNVRKPPCANEVSAIRSASQAWQADVSACLGSTCKYYSLPVKYCLSEPTEPNCKLHFSPIIAIIVTILNFFKAVLMFSTYATDHDPILTMGDAVISFLRKRDLATANVGLLNLQDLKTGCHTSVTPWHGKLWRWKDTTSKGRCTAILSLFVTLMAIVIFFLIFGVEDIKQSSAMSVSAIFRLGFGALDSRALIASKGFTSNLVALVLLSNTPQVLLSLLYFAYNGLFTAMLMGYEWASYAHKQKGLRVSGRPSGMQRSTYFLQLPYRFSITLTAISGLLHWSVSQSIFVVSFDLYDRFGAVEDFSQYSSTPIDPITKTCGYSPSAMLLTLVLGFVMILGLIGLGYMPYKSGMPLAGSCSFAISAACHPVQQSEAEDRALTEEKLQWGVVSTSPDGIGHCAFSSANIGALVKGRLYR